MSVSGVVLAMVFGSMAFVALVVFVNRHRPASSSGGRRTAASGSDGGLAWMGGDSSGSDCSPGDAGGGCDGGGGDGGGGAD